jgi:putative oxidoreductase
MNRQLSDDIGKLVLRLTTGILMLFHGVAKALHTDSLSFIQTRLADFGLPQLIAYGVYVGEILAPAMVILGIFSRIGGLIIVGNMVFAIMLAHSAHLFLLTEHGGWRLELQGFYLLCGLAIAFMGSGKFAIKAD